MTVQPGLRASVVIVGFNGEGFLRACLDSLGRTEMPSSKYEVLIIDNASKDATVSVAEQFRGRFPHLRVVRNERNVGFPAAVNQAAAVAESPILVLLNQDTVVEREWLSELLAPFERDPSVAAVGSRVVNGEGPGLYAAALEVLYGGICIVHEGNRRTDAVSGCAMAVRLDAFHRVGGLDGSLFMYGEDLDLGHRLRTAGYRIAYARSSVAHHAAVRGSRASSRTYMFYMARNRTLVCLRNYRWKRLYLLVDVFALFPLTAFAELVRSRAKKQALGWLLDARIASLRTGLESLRS
ncbi:MAG: glycosyltransferase family 2 protein, partial [Thermoplasmata archaeon]